MPDQPSEIDAREATTIADSQGLSATGLAEREAARRLQLEGFNELPHARAPSLASAALNVLREPMLLLLFVAAGMYLLVGDIEEAVLLLASVAFIVALSLYQERRTERALEALRDLASPRAVVIRDGGHHRIAGREVVRGDLVVLGEGDRVPADGIVVASGHLSVDESLLTGESVAVDKRRLDESGPESIGDQSSSRVFSGTLVVSGQAIVRIDATGARSRLAQIGQSLADVETERTPLQKESGRLVRVMAAVALTLCAVTATAQTLLTRNPVEGVLAGVTLAMALIPEEFPIVLTVFLAIGAWRMGKQNVLTRRIPALEALGATTVLCVDKTGTITQNQMSVRELATVDGRVDVIEAPALAERARALVTHAVLASQPQPIDPMERAILHLAEQAGGGGTPGRTLVQEFPLTRTFLAITRVWRFSDRPSLQVAAKGAPEAVVGLCNLPEAEGARIRETVDAMARDGLRIIGVARATWNDSSLPSALQEFPFEWLGLIGLADPVRPEVPGAVEECYSAGIRIIMITGDYPVTAQSIARAAGLQSPENVLTGEAIRALDDSSLGDRLRSVNVFARITPEQKLQLVQALRQQGHVVAMTGDGVNDAPALKAADIGVAMGLRGTDVAREAAALVLLDDAFGSIVAAVREGRRIYENLKKALGFIISVHIPIAGMSLIPILLGMPLVLLPAHVVFLELIIDPACSLAFEAEPVTPDLMQTPPRKPDQPFFSRRLLATALLRGVAGLCGALTVFLLATGIGMADDEARTAAFVALVSVALMLILVNRSMPYTRGQRGHRNRTATVVTLSTVAALVLVLMLPALRSLFGFAPLTVSEAVLSGAIGAVSVLTIEARRFFRSPGGQSARYSQR